MGLNPGFRERIGVSLVTFVTLRVLLRGPIRLFISSLQKSNNGSGSKMF